MNRVSWAPSVFEQLYADAEDPWDFRSSPYEQAKYAATVALLAQRRFATGLEIGCSIGVLTAKLAERCEQLLAIDCAEAALARAAAACPGVEFELHHVPSSFPFGRRFNLIVVSEVLYFLSPADVAQLAGLCREALVTGGAIVLANWTGATDTPCTGEQAADLFISACGLHSSPTVREATFRLDLLEG